MAQDDPKASNGWAHPWGRQAADTRVPQLSVIVPTFNERDNVALLVARLAATLPHAAWEVIFVDDDSPDGTGEKLREMARRDPRVRCLRRIGRRGLAGACIEGLLASSALAVAVMDGDLQHDETQLPNMLTAIERGADLVVGTRFACGSDAVAGLSRVRQLGSRLATITARRLLGVQLTDPLSGFFMIRRDVFEAVAPRLSTQGFKLLLDIVVSCPEPLQIVELPCELGARRHGQSKLDTLVVFEFLGLLVAKLSGDWLSIRFVGFALVGATGLVVHLWALQQALLLGLTFDWAQTTAAYLAMTSNFVLNNQLTYRDRRLKGWAAVGGLLTFSWCAGLGPWATSGLPNGTT